MSVMELQAEFAQAMLRGQVRHYRRCAWVAATVAAIWMLLAVSGWLMYWSGK